jgi:hypothetical protein
MIPQRLRSRIAKTHQVVAGGMAGLDGEGMDVIETGVKLVKIEREGILNFHIFHDAK